MTEIPNNLRTENIQNIRQASSGIVSTTINTKNNFVNRYSSTLNTVIPDSMFSGSIQDVQIKVDSVSNKFVNQLPKTPEIPTIKSLIPSIPSFVPQRISYAEIKIFIKQKIDSIKGKKQSALIQSQKSNIERAKDPFLYRQNIINSAQKVKINNVLR